MKKIIFSLFFVALIVSFQNSEQKTDKKRDVEAFKVGEKLTFSIGWEFISAGTAVMHVEDIQSVKDRSCYHISATTNSNSFFSTMYKVRDKLETYLDVEKMRPLKYIKKTREGDYKRDFEVHFDHEAGKAYIADADSGNSEVTIPANVQDIISSFYYVRRLPLEPGKDVQMSTFDNGKVKNVTVKVIKKEKISVTAGDFDCILVQTPIGPFSNKSDLNIWITDDHRRMPVLMKSKILVGSIRAELEKIEGE